MSAPILTTYPLREIIEDVRVRCPFYRCLYGHLGAAPALADLPIVDPEAFWQAHHRDPREVLTATPDNGIVFSSGGTTGAPKFSYYDNKDVDSTMYLSARGCEGTGLAAGDRVANLFAAGGLNGSLILANESLRAMSPSVLQFPVAYSPNYEVAAGLIRRFRIDTLAGFPTHLLGLVDYLDKEDLPRLELRRLLYAGELFSVDQEAFLRKRFPGLSIRSLSYASVDTGMIGYADDSCGLGVHRVFDGATLMEICDEVTGQPIPAPGQPGRVIYTSLTRRLMPLLRYPVGDLAEWLDEEGTPNRRFTLLGRSDEGARVSGFTVSFLGLRGLLEPFQHRLAIGGFQMLVTRENLRDRLTIRVVGDAPPETLAAGTGEILGAFERWQPELCAEMQAGIIHPMRVEWIGQRDLIVNERTGKLRRVIDRRAG